jgi:hypothetical protein
VYGITGSDLSVRRATLLLVEKIRIDLPKWLQLVEKLIPLLLVEEIRIDFQK